MINLTEYGYIPAAIPTDTGTKPARILATHRNMYHIICENGPGRARVAESYRRALLMEAAVLQGKTKYDWYTVHESSVAYNFPKTGDFVEVAEISEGEYSIENLLPRRSVFSRLDDTGHGEQAVAANFDYVFILSSLNRDLNLRRIERYLTLAWQSGAIPAVILTKADLVSDCSEYISTVGEIASKAEIVAVSARTGYGLGNLSGYLAPGKTVVFLGSSGVGKSSLVNALAGEEIMAVKEIREDDSRGRHTTTHRQLIMLKSGVMIIDTPGMREVGMWDITEGLGESFADVEQYLGRCRFRDCGHGTEPGCAVKAAIANGKLSAQRWNSYLSLRREAGYSDDRTGYLRKKQEWHKSIAKWSKQNKKNGGDAK